MQETALKIDSYATDIQPPTSAWASAGNALSSAYARAVKCKRMRSANSHSACMDTDMHVCTCKSARLPAPRVFAVIGGAVTILVWCASIVYIVILVVQWVRAPPITTSTAFWTAGALARLTARWWASSAVPPLTMPCPPQTSRLSA